MSCGWWCCISFTTSQFCYVLFSLFLIAYFDPELVLANGISDIKMCAFTFNAMVHLQYGWLYGLVWSAIKLSEMCLVRTIPPTNRKLTPRRIMWNHVIIWSIIARWANVCCNIPPRWHHYTLKWIKLAEKLQNFPFLRLIHIAEHKLVLLKFPADFTLPAPVHPILQKNPLLWNSRRGGEAETTTC